MFQNKCIRKVGDYVKIIEKEEFCRLIRIQETSMYRYALGMLRNPEDARDAVGETVLKAYTHLAQLRDPEHFKSWIMSILTNEIRTMLSKRNRVELSEDMTRYAQGTAVNDHGIWDTVMELPREFRDAVILYYYEGFGTKEIARMLKLPEGTVKSRLGRARAKLKTALEKGDY